MTNHKNKFPAQQRTLKSGPMGQFWRWLLIGILLLGSLPSTYTTYTAQAVTNSSGVPGLPQQLTEPSPTEKPSKEKLIPQPEQTPQPTSGQPGRNALTGNPITFTNSSVFIINDATTSTPYPSLITVTGLVTIPNGMTARLNGFTHSFASDADILLVRTGGQNSILMSDAGLSANVSNLNLTFDDNAATTISSSSSITNGTYRPTDYTLPCSTPDDNFPAPAPGSPYTATLSVFSGLDANTTWQLYGSDDCGSDSGQLTRGWSLIFYVNQAALGIVSGAEQSASVNTSFAQPLQAIVRDAAGAPMSGVAVTFTAPVNGATGRFANGSNIFTGTTDANGLITTTAFTANLTRGSYEIMVVAAGINVPLGFSLTNISGPATQVNVLSGNNQSSVTNIAFASRLSAVVSDVGNNPVSGKTITFTAPASGASGKFSNGTTTYVGTSNSSGIVTATTFTANAILGSYVVTATVSGVVTPATFVLTNTNPAIKVSSGSGQGAAINTAFGQSLVALVTTNDTNVPVSGQVVTFTAPAGGASGKFANGTNTYVGTSNSNGLVTASAFTANDTTGSYSVTAVVANGTTPVDFVLTNTPPSTIQFASDSYTVSEGVGTAVFTLTRTGGSGGAVSASLVGGNLTADNTDYKLPDNGSALDVSFDPGTGTPGETYKTIVLPDGKILLAGNFATYNGQSVGRIARLNEDGSLDTSFLSTGAGSNGTIHGMIRQPDGKIIIMGGDFATYNGVARNRIARLNEDGSLDTSFVITGTGASDSIFRAALQPDGKILIGGNFTTYNGITTTRIARLNSDGSVDETFNSTLGANSTVWAILVQPDGKIVIGGNFTTYAGVTRSRVARLNSDGSLDTTFMQNNTGVNSTIWVMALQPDGKIILGGDFTTYNGVTRNNIARLNTDGTLDTAYPGNGTGANESIRAMDWQADGKLIIGGAFTTFNQNRAIRVARLNTDGSLDTAFTSLGAGPNNLLWTVTSQPDNKVIVGGDLTTYDGVSRNHVARGGGVFAYWADGDTSPKTVTVTITDDNLVESNEQFNITINGASAGATIGSPTTTAVTIVDNEPITITAVSGSGQSTTGGGAAFGQPLVVSVVNTSTSPISGAVVTFTAPASGASATFANGSNVYTATTNASGLANSGLLTANNISGTYTVTAMVAGVANPVNFTLTNIVTCNPLVVTSALDNGSCGTLRAAATAATAGQTITITLNAGSVINLSSGITLGMGVNLTASAGCSTGPSVTLQGTGQNSGTGLRLLGNNNVSNVAVRGFNNRQIATLGLTNVLRCVRAFRS